MSPLTGGNIARNPAVTVPGPAPAPGVAAAKQFLATVRRIEELEQGVQVRLVNHGFSDPQCWERVDRLAQRKPGEPHPLVAPELFVPWLQQLKTQARRVIEAAQPR
jgi:hypothetical protein